MNKNIIKKLGFKKEVELVEKDKCPFCKNYINIEDFINESSKKEYEITGICQKCQDKFFNKPK